MNKISKKAVAVGLSLTTAAWLVGGSIVPLVANAASLTDAQIQSILSLLQSFGADSATVTNVSNALKGKPTAGGGAAAACSFTSDLKVGSKGDAVKCLQQYLNGAGYPVAASGAGSAGNESTSFGSLTKAAVAKWQAANSVSPAAGYFGSVSRAKYTSLAGAPSAPGAPAAPGVKSGKQGTMDVKLAPSPASGEDLYEAEAGQPVYGIEVKASDSEVYVSRIKLQFNTAINNIISKVGVYRDGKLLVERDVNVDAVTRITSSNYTLQLTGFESKVDQGTTGTFEVRVNALSSIDSGYTAFTVLAPVNAVRAVDGANVNLDGPSTALISNSVNVKQSGASAALLTISKNSSTPEQANVIADSTGKADKVTLLVMNVKAEQDAIKLTDLRASTTKDGSGPATAATAYLYDGTTLVDSATISSGDANFDNFNWTVPKDTTKQLTMKVDFTGVTNVETMFSASTTVNTVVVAEGSDGIAIATANKTVNAVGNNVHLFRAAPVFTLTNATAVKNAGVQGVSSATGDITIKFSALAKGGDVKVSSTNAIDVSAFKDGTASTTLISEAYTVDGATLSGSVYTVSQDSTAVFTVSGQLNTSGWTGTANDGNYDFRLTTFGWAPTGSGGTAGVSTTFLDDLGVSPFKTNTIVLK